MNILKGFFKFIKKHKIISVVVFVIILGLVYYFRPKPVPPPQVYTVNYSNLIQTVSVSGNIVAKNQADLSFPTTGDVVYLGAKLNNTVKQGQLIAQQDQRTVLKNLQQSLIAYSLARNTYDQNIANNNGISSPNDALNDTMKRVLQDNQYNLQAAVVSVELQDLARQNSMIFSPINGILTRSDVTEVGSLATTTTVWTVTDPKSLAFDMDVDEADIAKVQNNDQVQISLDAYPNKTFYLPVSSIAFVSHTTSNGSVAFTVETKLPVSNSSYDFRVGMQGNANIVTAVKKHVLTIPLSAVSGNNSVFVKVPKGFVEKQITLGLENDTDVEVLSGLKNNDQIAMQPNKILPSEIVK